MKRKVAGESVIHPDTKQPGSAAGLWSVHHGEYTGVLIWDVPRKRGSPRRMVREYNGRSVRELAEALRADGWNPPRSLGRLCESAPSSSWL